MKDQLAEIKERLEAAGYAVLSDGRIYSHKTNWRGYGTRLMKQDLNSYGYPRVRLTVDGKRKKYMVHKLVAEIYLGAKPSCKHGVCHKDGNKLNNTVNNLYWGTPKDNAADRTRHGNCKAAENGRKSTWKRKHRLQAQQKAREIMGGEG